MAPHARRSARRRQLLLCACVSAALQQQLGRTAACSFLVTTKPDVPMPAHSDGFDDPTHWNYYMKMRGPDLTNSIRAHGMFFLHNLLHMTGEVRALARARSGAERADAVLSAPTLRIRAPVSGDAAALLR